MPKHLKKTIRKGPLLFTAALICTYPLLIAEQALASTTNGVQNPYASAYGNSQLPIQTNQRSSLGLPQQNPTRTTSSLVQTRFPYSYSNSLQEDLADAVAALQQAESNLALNTTTLTRLREELKTLQKDLEAANLLLTQAQTKYEAAKANTSTALSVRDAAAEDLEHAQAAKAYALQEKQTADAAVTSQLLIKNSAQQTFNDASLAHSNALEAKNTAYAELQTATYNYNNNLIPDPTWIAPTYQQAHTRQVSYTETVATTTRVSHIEQVPVTTEVATTTLIPHTTYTTTGGVTAEIFNRQGYNNAPPMPSSYETPNHTQTVNNIDFNWGGGRLLNSYYYEDAIIKFTGYITVPTTDDYYFYTPADDGTRLYIDDQLLINDWYDKGGGGSTSGPVHLEAGTSVPFTLYYYENGGGAAVSFRYVTMDTGYYQAVPSSWLGQQTESTTWYEEVTTWETVTTYEDVTVWEDVTTYEEVTRYREETYYTTEPVLTEQTINVDINEGGQATFTAPAGATFTSSNLRYEARDRPQCGTNIYPQVNGLSTVTLRALNSVYGDPCGGWYKHIVGTLTYTAQPTAPLINDPALLTILNQKQENYDEASSSYQATVEPYNQAQSDLDTATSNLASSEVTATLAATTYNEASINEQTASEELTSANTSLTSYQSSETIAQQEEVAAQSKVTAAQSKVISTDNDIKTAESKETAARIEVATLNTKVTTLENTPEPTPPPVEPEEPETVPEEGSKEIPTDLSAENLMEVDLAVVDPAELTDAQVEQLQEAAYETFETAEQGSEEYEQALDALYLAAEADDIVLDPALAAVPGAQEVVAVLNFISNVGADIAPAVREKAQQVVVTTVVVGQIAAAAAASQSMNRKN